MPIWMEDLKSLWFEYYPIVVGAITALGGVIATVIFVWSKIQPYLEKLNVIKDKVTDTSKEDLSSKLQSITLDTQITDLKAKIENPTISTELKQQYITQLANLETLKLKIESGLAVVDSTTNKYL